MKQQFKVALSVCFAGLMAACTSPAYTSLAGPNLRTAQSHGNMPTPDPSTGLYSLDVYAKRIAYYQQTGSDPKELAYSIKTYDFLKHRQEALDKGDSSQAAMWQEKAIKLKHDYDAQVMRTNAAFAAAHPNPLPPATPTDPCIGLGKNLPGCAPQPSTPMCRQVSADGGTVICQ
jgi:hypothetical protein